MQINGIGGSHDSEHHVTNCIHHSGDMKKQTGNMASPASKSVQQMMAEENTQSREFSLMTWLRDRLNFGKRIWGSIWGSGAVQGAAEGEAAVRDVHAVHKDTYTDSSSASAASSGLHTAQVAAASAAVQNPQSMLRNNPYFSAIEDTGRQKVTLREKAKVKFQAVTGYLTRNFFGKKSFQAKQEQPKEDLRRQSRYRQDDLEVDCILTDDSFLLDSYDKKGEYSKLSAGK